MDFNDPESVAIVVDKKNSRVMAFKQNVLVNQISRDAERIARSFDEHHSYGLLRISKLFATTSALLMSGLLKARDDEDDLRISCGELISNVLNSIAAASLLLRSGFVLQPGIVLRTALEQIAVVLHLMQYQNDLDSYKITLLTQHEQ